MLLRTPVRTVLALFGLYLASAVPFLLGKSLGSRQFESLPSTIIWAMGIPLFFSAALHLLKWNGMGDISSLGLLRRGWGRHFTAGAAIGLLWVLLVLALGIAGGRYTVTGFGEMLLSLRWLLVFMASALWTAASEELVYRGYLNRAVPATWAPYWPYLATAVLFAAAHIDTQGAAPVRMAELALKAIIYMAVLRATGSVWFAIGAHWSWNTFNLWVLERNLLLVKQMAPGSSWVGYSQVVVLVATLPLVYLVVRWLKAEQPLQIFRGVHILKPGRVGEGNRQ